jgi:hypothetical protein
MCRAAAPSCAMARWMILGWRPSPELALESRRIGRPVLAEAPAHHLYRDL